MVKKEKPIGAKTVTKPTLLQQFILQKINNYVEPSRLGTSKGEPIGFTKQKYTASLLMLQSLAQKNIAEIAGVSHGLLRKWNTEETFKNMIIQHAEDFGELFIKHWSEKAQRYLALKEAFFKIPITDWSKKMETRISFDEISDWQLYSADVVDAIGRALLKWATDREAFEAILVWKITEKVSSKYSKGPFFLGYPENVSSTLGASIYMMTEIIAKKKYLEKDLNNLAYCFSILDGIEDLLSL